MKQNILSCFDTSIPSASLAEQLHSALAMAKPLELPLHFHAAMWSGHQSLVMFSSHPLRLNHCGTMSRKKIALLGLSWLRLPAYLLKCHFALLPLQTHVLQNSLIWQMSLLLSNSETLDRSTFILQCLVGLLKRSGCFGQPLFFYRFSSKIWSRFHWRATPMPDRQSELRVAIAFVSRQVQTPEAEPDAVLGVACAKQKCQCKSQDGHSTSLTEHELLTCLGRQVFEKTT